MNAIKISQQNHHVGVGQKTIILLVGSAVGFAPNPNSLSVKSRTPTGKEKQMYFRQKCTHLVGTFTVHAAIVAVTCFPLSFI